mgnify:CR=1 FL=1
MTDININNYFHKIKNMGLMDHGKEILKQLKEEADKKYLDRIREEDNERYMASPLMHITKTYVLYKKTKYELKNIDEFRYLDCRNISKYVYRDKKTQLLRCVFLGDGYLNSGIDVPLITYNSGCTSISAKQLEDFCFDSFYKNDVDLCMLKPIEGGESIIAAAYKTQLIDEIVSSIFRSSQKDLLSYDQVDLEKDFFFWKMISKYKPTSEVYCGEVDFKSTRTITLPSSNYDPLEVFLYNKNKIPVGMIKLFEFSSWFGLGDEIDYSEFEIAVFQDDKGNEILRVFSSEYDTVSIDSWNNEKYHHMSEDTVMDHYPEGPEPDYEREEERRMYEDWTRDAFEDEPESQWGVLD